MKIVGVDPSITATGFAMLDNGSVVRVAVVRKTVKTTSDESMFDAVNRQAFYAFNDCDRFAVEYPEYRHSRAKNSPNSLIRMALMAGAAFAGLSTENNRGEFLVPSRWKGTVAKIPHHRRLMRHLDWSFEEEGGRIIPHYPSTIQGAAELKPADWEHVLDAIGIAYWVINRKGV